MASILVIDDDDVFRTALAKILQAAGHVVATASDGFAGARFCRSSPPDLILLDMIMPYGGLETIRVVHSEHPSIPIVSMSGADPRRLDYAKVLGAVDTVAKPFSPTELLAVVNRALAAGCAVPSSLARCSDPS